AEEPARAQLGQRDLSLAVRPLPLDAHAAAQDAVQGHRGIVLLDDHAARLVAAHARQSGQVPQVAGSQGLEQRHRAQHLGHRRTVHDLRPAIAHLGLTSSTTSKSWPNFRSGLRWGILICASAAPCAARLALYLSYVPAATIFSAG